MTKFKPLPPLERLNELFEVVEIPEDQYGKASGLIRKLRRKGRDVGTTAGSLNKHKTQKGRFDWRVRVDGEHYMAARVIYYMVYERKPEDFQVDHKDKNPLNNNAWNLRLDVDGTTQSVNKRIARTNTSGVIGVSWNKVSRKWRAQVQGKSNYQYLGYFTCLVEAARVVNAKWIEMGWVEIGRLVNDLECIECNCESCLSVVHDQEQSVRRCE